MVLPGANELQTGMSTATGANPAAPPESQSGGRETPLPPPLPAATTTEERRNRRAWKCRRCENAYDYANLKCCSVKICPYRIPKLVRLPYRKQETPGPPAPVRKKEISPALREQLARARAARKPKPVAPAAAPPKSEASAGLPQFRWWWFPSVQRKWLEVFERLAAGK